jgi:DNA-binding beta-propeller fold protein YncE
LAITGLTPNFAAFHPNHIVYQDGQIYLADGNKLLAAIIDSKGNVKRTFDLAKTIELEEKDKDNSLMDGFSVDKDGSMLFTLPMLFTAYRVSLEGKSSSFGKPGSIPGNFGVISGIIADNRGNYLVSDKLKCVVMVFDKNFKFQLEFGGRGRGPGQFIIPQQLAIDSSDRVYVIQEGNRGVSVFSMQYVN